MGLLKLSLCYDGTAYVGWQRQENGVSIQGLLEAALAPIEGAPVTVHGAGRTDAGVHALGQVAHVALSSCLDEATLARALNAVLPGDVRVLAVEQAPPGFHARFSARRKVYEYRFVTSAVVSPFVRRYVWHVGRSLDVEAMRAAAEALVGSHDFAGFQGAGSDVATTDRRMFEVGWSASGDGALEFRIEGDGFLRHMVRNIAGTLVEIGIGRWPASRISRVLLSRDRSEAGPTAPPQGLHLVHVGYDEPSVDHGPG